jgi:rod shape determining protein RodA
MKSFVRNIDFFILFSLLSLFLISFFSIYSSGYPRGMEGIAYTQIIWFCTGLVIIAVTQNISMKSILALSNMFYAVLIVMLILVYLIGSVRMGARRWIEIGSFQFQPSELGKFFLLCTLARYYSAGKINWSDKKYTIIGSVLTIIPFILVLKEPDLGSAIIYLYIFIAVIFAAGFPYFYLFNMFALSFFLFAKGIGDQFFITALVFYGIVLYKYSVKLSTGIVLWSSGLTLGIASNLFWEGLKEYQKMRLLTFLDPEKFSKDGGWQIIQAKTAVSNGDFYGMGYMNGSQTQLRFLPEGHTDFIFSVISEELGLIGILILIIAFSVLFYRLVKIVSKTRSRYLYLLGSGITALIIFQTVLNISISLGLLPVTGLPLPFVSYGGSALMMNMLMIGIVMNIGKHENNI